MTEEREHPIDDLAAYSLGSLEAPEARHVERHLATCTACGTLLRQYQTVVGTLPLGLDPVGPPRRRGRPSGGTCRSEDTRPTEGSSCWQAGDE